MKKLLEEKLGKISFIQIREAHTYYIEASQSSIEASSNTSCEVLIRGVQTIRELTGWTDHVNITIIRSYLVDDHSVDITRS